MARFHSYLWEGTGHSRDEIAGALLSTFILWLRSMDGDIGLENYLRLLVPFSNDLYFGAHVPPGPENRLPVSDGTVLPVIGHGRRIVWARCWRRELNLAAMQYTSDQTKIHMDWIEWALGWAIVMLWESDTDWLPAQVKPTQTIGGLEVADFGDEL